MDGSAAIGVDETLTRTTNPAATDKIAQLRSIANAFPGDHVSQAIDLIADILQDLNEVPLYR